jgi:hypothetical protein
MVQYIDCYHILMLHPYITSLTSYAQYCKPRRIQFGMKNLNMYYTFKVII